MPVPKHIASVQDPLRHHDYSRSFALLLQAQLLESKVVQVRGGNRQKRVIDRTVISHLWPPLSVSSSVAGANFVVRQGAGSLLSLSARLPPQRHASPLDLLPPPGEIPNLLPSYLCPPALPFSLCLLQLLPSTQDLPEMCRWWLPGNTTVLLKLRMESSQSGLWLAGDLQ